MSTIYESRDDSKRYLVEYRSTAGYWHKSESYRTAFFAKKRAKWWASLSSVETARVVDTSPRKVGDATEKELTPNKFSTSLKGLFKLKEKK